MKEAQRLELMSRIAERRLTERRAAELMGLSERQMRRLYRSYKNHGADGLRSGHRGKPSNRRLAEATKKQARELVREQHARGAVTNRATDAHVLAN